MTSSLGFAELSDTNKDIKDVYKPTSNKKKHNQTYKKRKITGKNVENFLNLMSKVGNDDSNDGSGLADFNPPPKPELTKQPPEIQEENVDSSLSPKEFKDLDEYSGGNAKFNQYIPYSTNTQTNPQLPEHKDKLFERLNYVIHLLEENKDHKTQNVTEELVLYMFLGVFVIFVVDSFARANKYTR